MRYTMKNYNDVPITPGTTLRSVQFPTIEFVKLGVAKKWRSSEGQEFNNVGDMLWEWGQGTGLELVDSVEEAVKFFESYDCDPVQLYRVARSGDVMNHLRTLVNAAKK